MCSLIHTHNDLECTLDVHLPVMVLVFFLFFCFGSCLLSIQFQFPVYLQSSCSFSVDYPIIDSRCVLFAHLCQPLYTPVFSVLVIESCPCIDLDKELCHIKEWSDFLLLYSTNLQNLAIVEMRVVKFIWSSNTLLINLHPICIRRHTAHTFSFLQLVYLCSILIKHSALYIVA